MPGINVGYLPQEPRWMRRRRCARSRAGRGDVAEAKKQLERIYAAYPKEGADFDKLAAEQATLEAIVNRATRRSGRDRGDALRLPAWDAEDRGCCRAAKSAAWRCASCCCQSRPAAAR
jgi:sulfate-transporting ATPase